jgi:predicted metal-binding protein
MKDQLLFVYNAKSDLMNKTFDFMHKFVSPQTYECNLCLLTHTNIGERKEWSDFKNSLGVEMRFLYSNIFETEFPNEKSDYPVVFLNSKNELKKLINTVELNSIKKVKELIQLVKEKTKV